MNMNDHFGVCPECFQEGKLDEEYLYLNVGKDQFMTCKHHKRVWHIGTDVFSSWQYENQKLWDENLRMLEKEYKLVESADLFVPQETILEGDEPF